MFQKVIVDNINGFQPRNRVSTIILGYLPRFIEETRFLNPGVRLKG